MIKPAISFSIYISASAVGVASDPYELLHENHATFTLLAQRHTSFGPVWDAWRNRQGCPRELAQVGATLPSGPVAQWIRHRPTEPGIAGSSPAGVILAVGASVRVQATPPSHGYHPSYPPSSVDDILSNGIAF
jgi:hypothetical protein